MKVCHVIGSLSMPLDEGTSKSVVNITRKMEEKGHNSFIYTRPKKDKGKNTVKTDLTVYRNEIRPGSFFKNRKRIKELKPDIVHVHSSNPLMALYFDKIHENTLWTAPAFRGSEKTIKIWKTLCRNQKTLATSEKVAGNIPGEVEVLPYGIDTEKFRCERNPEISENPRILFMSSTKEKRGFFAAIDIVKKIMETRNPEFHVAVREKYTDKAESILEEEGISKISKVRGFVKDLPDYFNKMDVVLYPVKSSSGFTSPPLIALEAMSCGRITVCTGVKDFREVIENGEDGLIYEYGEEDEVAERLLDLKKDEVEKMSEKARKKIISEYSLENTVERYLEIYREIQ